MEIVSQQILHLDYHDICEDNPLADGGGGGGGRGWGGGAKGWYFPVNSIKKQNMLPKHNLDKVNILKGDFEIYNIS